MRSAYLPVFYFYPLALMPGLLQWSTNIEVGTRNLKFEKFRIQPFLIGLGLFRHLTFRQETFRHGHFITGTFPHKDISAREHFGMGMRHLGTRIFQHIDILAQGHPCQNVCAKM